MPGPSDLYDAAAEWLAVCEAAVATGPGGAIIYAYVSPGPPSLDCAPQLTVHVGGPQEGDTLPLTPPLVTGHRDTVQGAVHLVNLTATVVRCVPVLMEGGQLPSIASMEQAAQEVDADVWSIWNATRARHRDGSLYGTPSNRRELFLDPAYPLVPSGGFAGWQIPIRVQLDGYPA